MKEQVEFDGAVARQGRDWRPVVQLGLLAGLAAIYVSLVGMVDTFGEKDVISGLISQGYVLLIIIWFGFGYLVSRREAGGTAGQLIARGAMVSGIGGAVLVLLLLIAEPFNLRRVLVNASPSLVDMVTLDLGIGVGSVVVLALAIMLGLAGASIPYWPEKVRRPLMMALIGTLAIGVFQDVLAPILPQVLSRFLFAISGLSLEGGATVFVLMAGLTALWDLRGEEAKERWANLPGRGTPAFQYGAWAVAVVLVLVLPQLVGSFLSDVLSTVGLYVLMGLGLNIVVGYAGLLDLGYVAFFAIGAYVTAVLTSTGDLGFGWNWWLAVPFAVVGAMLTGIVLGVPVLQMRGDYLAIVTMGFGEIIRILVKSDALRPWIGGAQGILAVPKINVLGLVELRGPQQLLYLILLACLLAVFISRRLADSRIGRAWMAIREDEDVAEAMGIALVKHKLLAFAAGAAFAGLSGAIFASKLGSVFPHSMKLEVSIWVLCLIIVGGMGSIPGVAVGALFMMGLPELLRTFAEYRLLFYGALLVVMMLVRPEGLWPEEGRRRELRAGMDDEGLPDGLEDLAERGA